MEKVRERLCVCSVSMCVGQFAVSSGNAVASIVWEFTGQTCMSGCRPVVQRCEGGKWRENAVYTLGCVCFLQTVLEALVGEN